MIEVSTAKKKILNENNIDLNDVPENLLENIHKYESITTPSERTYLSNNTNLSGNIYKTFSIKDIIGTKHPDYYNKSWIEAFILSKRGDIIIDKYYQNPDYYTKLKQFDQPKDLHDTPIELFEIDGKFVIAGGNNRLLLLKIKYLSEISKAQTEEEKHKINEKYTFIGKVSTLPTNRKIVDIITMTENDFPHIKFKNLNFDKTSCNYEVSINGQIYIVNSYNELLNLFKHIYSLPNIKGDNLYSKIIEFGSNYIQANSNIKNVFKEIYPNIDNFIKLFLEARRIDENETMFDALEPANQTLDYIINNIQNIVSNLKQKTLSDKIREIARMFNGCSNKKEISAKINQINLIKEQYSLDTNEILPNYDLFVEFYKLNKDSLDNIFTSDFTSSYGKLYSILLSAEITRRQKQINELRKQEQMLYESLNNLQVRKIILDNVDSYINLKGIYDEYSTKLARDTLSMESELRTKNTLEHEKQKAISTSKDIQSRNFLVRFSRRNELAKANINFYYFGNSIQAAINNITELKEEIDKTQRAISSVNENLSNICRFNITFEEYEHALERCNLSGLTKDNLNERITIISNKIASLNIRHYQEELYNLINRSNLTTTLSLNDGKNIKK